MINIFLLRIVLFFVYTIHCSAIEPLELQLVENSNRSIDSIVELRNALPMVDDNQSLNPKKVFLKKPLKTIDPLMNYFEQLEIKTIRHIIDFLGNDIDVSLQSFVRSSKSMSRIALMYNDLYYKIRYPLENFNADIEWLKEHYVFFQKAFRRINAIINQSSVALKDRELINYYYRDSSEILKAIQENELVFNQLIILQDPAEYYIRGASNLEYVLELAAYRDRKLPNLAREINNLQQNIEARKSAPFYKMVTRDL